MTNEERERLAVQLITDGVAEGLTIKKKKADRALVRELTSNAVDGSEIRKTGFHDAVRQATSELRDRELWRAKAMLQRDPSIAFDGAAEQDFRGSFPNTDDRVLTSLIEGVRRARKLG